MTQFTIHTTETASEGARPMLEMLKSKNGFVPNILGAMADAPGVLKSYLDIAGNIAAGTLSNTEQQVIQITTSRLNGCEYCVAAHSTIAKGQKVDAEVLEAVRHQKPIADTKLEALRQFTTTMVDKQGWVTEGDIQSLLQAGYTRGQVLEVVLSMTLKFLTNTVNHVVQTPIDAQFAPQHLAFKETSCCGGGCHSDKMAS